MSITGNKIFLSGGAGFLGSKIVERFYPDNEIVVYSRDEAKHYFLKKRFPKIKCIIGDVADLDSLVQASKGCSLAIYCAALKQIESVEENPLSGLNTIGIGAINSKRASLENNIKSSCIISSDKASAPQTSYGALKLFSENVFVNNNFHEEYSYLHDWNFNTGLYGPYFSACRYGNVSNSKGSVIPLIWDAIKHSYSLKLYSPEMTRFIISVEEAIDLIVNSLQETDKVIIPHIQSFSVLDLFEIYKDKYGLIYEIGEPRPNEKIHEILFSGPESRRITFNKENNIFLLDNYSVVDQKHIEQEYSSKDHCMDRIELDIFLESNNYFK